MARNMDDPTVGANAPPSPGLATGNQKTVRKVFLGCLLVSAVVFVILSAGFLYVYYFLERQTAERERVYYTAAPGTKIFVNKVDAVPADLKEGFVPFAFHYPDTFAVVPDKTSFIRLERQENGAVVATFTVAPLTIPSRKEPPGTIYPPLMNNLSKELATRNAGYQEISQKPADFKSSYSYHDGWDMRWQADAQNGPGSGKLYGRVLFLRDSVTSRGVMLNMTEAASGPAVDEAAAVGERGELATMIRSFRLLYTAPSHASAAQEYSRSRSGGRH